MIFKFKQIFVRSLKFWCCGPSDLRVQIGAIGALQEVAESLVKYVDYGTACNVNQQESEMFVTVEQEPSKQEIRLFKVDETCDIDYDDLLAMWCTIPQFQI